MARRYPVAGDNADHPVSFWKKLDHPDSSLREGRVMTV
jgi:hypothetical protein